MESVIFSDLVRDIIQTSGKLAAQFGYDYVDSEHLLLAVIDESLRNPKAGNILLKTLKHFNIDLFALIEDIEGTFDVTKISLSIEKIPFTNKVNKMLRISFLEARSLQSFHSIEAEHIFLAYLHIGSGFSKNELGMKYNLTYEQVRDFIRKA